MRAVKTIAESFVATAGEERREQQARAKMERKAADLRAELGKLADWIELKGTECLNSDLLSEKDRMLVTENRDRLDRALRIFDVTLGSTLSPARRVDLLWLITEAIWSASVLAHFSPPLEIIAKREKELTAAHARQERATTPEEIALLKAIFVCQGDRLIDKTSKTASSMHADVNKLLTGGGFPEVNVDVIRRRLDKIRRALQERAKTR
jgi:hypothetical protein